MEPITRREFLERTAGTGVGLSALYLFGPGVQRVDAADAYPANRHLVYEDGKEYMSFSTARPFQPYMTKPGPTDAATWMQIDLGSSEPIQAVKLFPAMANGWGFWTDHFPRRFKIEASDDAAFAMAMMIADETAADFDAGLLRIWSFPGAARGRYVRVTVSGRSGDRVRLSKIAVISGDKDIAVGCPVTADPGYGNMEGSQQAAQLTRPYRPMGEGIITDHPENVTDNAHWTPPEIPLSAPLQGVTLAGGVFQKVMENNVRYLLQTDTLNHHLHYFFERAGKTPPPDAKPQEPAWETYLNDSSAGRFLMGAGNTLRWMEHSELRARMNALVDGIEACRERNGYILAYAPETVFDCERGAYDRAWLTHGLIEAGRAGNSKAFGLLRGFYDWFNQWPNLPKLLRGAGQGGQGMIANTRMYHATPVGSPADIQVVQRHFQENFWMDGLAKRDPEMVWLYPYDRPHAYLLTNLEAYFDLYLATGDSRYLDAVRGGWELFHDHWEHVGGTIAICEFDEYPPDSYRLQAGTGEFCGSVFWLRLNQRFHFLYPDEEKYIGEMEKSIYNVGLANQVDDKGIIYTTRLLKGKAGENHHNTCCEGQGTRLYGSLPEYIYSLSSDGVYVDLFEPSTLTWKHRDRELRLKMTTRFPMAGDVHLEFGGGISVPLKIRIRVPGWATQEMEIQVNGTVAALGKPGSYVTLERQWSELDAISFHLPLGFRLTRYEGRDLGHQPAYALEYGPILMVAAGSTDFRFKIAPGQTPEETVQSLEPREENSLRFKLGEDGPDFVPYWQMKPAEPFICFGVASA